MYLNSINFIGRLVATVDFTKGDKADGSNDRAWGRVASNRPNSEEVDFVPFVCWAGTARAVADHCGKGKVLILSGRLSTRSKQRDDGSYDNYAEINCSSVGFGPDAKNAGQPEQAAQATAPAAQTPAPDQAAVLAAQVMAVIQAQADAAATPAAAVGSGESAHNPFA